jgi:fused signal recognition particle receptor
MPAQTSRDIKMFKRIRENLFGRPVEPQVPEEAVSPPSEDQPEDAELDAEIAAAPATPDAPAAAGAVADEPPGPIAPPAQSPSASPMAVTPPGPSTPLSVAPVDARAAPPDAAAPQTPGASAAIVERAASRAVPAREPATPPPPPAEPEAAAPPTVRPADTAPRGFSPDSPAAAGSALQADIAHAEVMDEEDEAQDDQEGGVRSAPGARDRGVFRNPFRFSLGRTRQLFGRVNEAFKADDITDELWDELEETLITSDVGVTTTERLLQILRERAQVENMTRGSQLRDALREELELLLGDPEPLVFSDTSPLTVFLVVGVNGVGKTTSIAKLANVLKRQKHRVMLAAGDTFRAAATEQIRTWGERIGVPVISHQYGADPAAVVYDAVQAAQARGNDVLIVDTAGRLHTKFNLMEELKKIGRVLQKYDPEAPHEVLLVVDATTGQNGYLQAKQFIADAGVSGIILTKLDGTARGGIVFAIASELGLPIKFVGTGEKVGDIAPFDPVEFVEALFEDD